MQKLNIPEDYQTVMPYLILQGAARFLEFTKQVFRATEKHLTRTDDERDIRHAEIMIGDSTIMFASSTDEFPPQTAGMYIHVVNADESYQTALDAGATSIMPPADQPYGRSCGVKDPCGNTWWITSAL